MARATSPSCTIPAFLRGKGLPVPAWLERLRPNMPDVFTRKRLIHARAPYFLTVALLGLCRSDRRAQTHRATATHAAQATPAQRRPAAGL